MEYVDSIISHDNMYGFSPFTTPNSLKDNVSVRSKVSSKRSRQSCQNHDVESENENEQLNDFLNQSLEAPYSLYSSTEYKTLSEELNNMKLYMSHMMEEKIQASLINENIFTNNASLLWGYFKCFIVLYCKEYTDDGMAIYHNREKDYFEGELFINSIGKEIEWNNYLKLQLSKKSKHINIYDIENSMSSIDNRENIHSNNENEEFSEKELIASNSPITSASNHVLKYEKSTNNGRWCCGIKQDPSKDDCEQLQLNDIDNDGYNHFNCFGTSHRTHWICSCGKPVCHPDDQTIHGIQCNMYYHHCNRRSEGNDWLCDKNIKMHSKNEKKKKILS